MTTYKFLFIALFASLIGCKSTPEAKEEENLPEDIVELRDDQIKLANIDLGTIQMHEIGGTIKSNGIISVAPQGYATVCMPLGGFIKSTNLMPGNSVTKGETLAILENQDFVDIQQNYLEAKNKLDYAEAEFNRHSELFKEDVYSQKNLQQVTADYKNLKAQVKALEQKLALIGINPNTLEANNISSSVPLVSPISGYVTAVNVNIGKFVSPSDVLFEIVNSSKLFLELTLFEQDAHKVAVGQAITFLINNETEEHQALIYQTGKAINADKSYKIYATIPQLCPNTLPGMYVSATIKTSGQLVTAVPSEAIVNFADKDYIFLFEKNKEEGGKPFTEYRMVEIQKGNSSNGFTQVTLPSTINIATTQVVVKGAYNLLSAKKNAGEMSC